jgi:hypothetical protein
LIIMSMTLPCFSQALLLLAVPVAFSGLVQRNLEVAKGTVFDKVEGFTLQKTKGAGVFSTHTRTLTTHQHTCQYFTEIVGAECNQVWALNSIRTVGPHTAQSMLITQHRRWGVPG